METHLTVNTFPVFSIIFLSVVLRPNAGHRNLILEVSRSHSMKHILSRTPLEG